MVYFDHILHMHVHVNISLPLACITTFSMDEGLLSISPACCSQLVKRLRIQRVNILFFSSQRAIRDFFLDDKWR